MTSDKDLTLTPLKGKSGQAFMGTYPNGERVFVKLNTQPILAALSKEQIAPHILGTRWTTSGDELTLQEWLDGRLLERQDMASKQVGLILWRLHKSGTLVNRLKQLGYQIENPYDLITSWENNAPQQLLANTYLQSIVQELKRNLPEFKADLATIVHGDIRHSNWVVTTSGMVYLVDWDRVRFTDRMFDVAHLVSHYIPKNLWQSWLSNYGYKDNDLVRKKFYWYGQLSYLNQILTFFDLREMDKVNQEIYDLRQFRNGMAN